MVMILQCPSAGLSLDNSGHPLCYRRCTPQNYETIYDLFIGNTFLALLWFFGEHLLEMFSVELRAEISEGKEWQKELDATDQANGFPSLQSRINAVRHSEAWNEELAGWNERKKRQKEIFGGNAWKRAYLFYLMYFCIGAYSTS